MSDIFREVEEDIRREQLRKLWDRYGLLVIGAALLVVLVTAGWRGWEWYQDRRAAQAGEVYYEALDLAGGGDHAEAAEAFMRIAADQGPFAPFARMRAASSLASAGDRDGAVSAFDAVAADRGVDALLRDTARIRAGYLLVDDADPDEIESRVGDLASGDSHWRHSARELLGLAAYRAGDLETAFERFQEILGDNETPQDLRSRAQLMIALVAADRPAIAEAVDVVPPEDGTDEP